MKKITIIFMSVLMIFASCSTGTSYDDNEIEEKTNTEKEDDSENNTEEPSNEEPKEDNSKNNTEEPSNEEDNSENDNDEEGNSENTEIVEESKEDDTEIVEDEPLNEEPKDDSENNTEESLNEDGSENEVVEDKTWCEIDENINILELNYIGYYENFTAIFNSDSNDSELVKTTPFTMRCNIPSSNGGSREIVITVKYNEGKLDFSINSQSPYYTIKCVNYSKLTSTIDIMILHK